MEAEDRYGKDMKPEPKPLAQYLGEYIDHELCNNTEHDSWRELLEQVLDAYQSTQQVEIIIEKC